MTKRKLTAALREAFDAGWFAYECADRPRDQAKFRKQYVDDKLKEISNDNGRK
jgi:hypothetical protein